ncbi:MAG: hypothetical protein ABIY47_09075 [Opitutaceae bacterium]
MTDSRRTLFPAWLATIIIVVATATLLRAACAVMFSAFMFYDDEGYVLISLRNFAEHGKLYSEVFTQYGPFPFVFYSALHALGFPFTHNAGRIFTLGVWGGAALLCAWSAGRATRSLLASLAVMASVFVYLWVMASEPTHPGGLIVLIVALLAALGIHWIREDRLRAWAILAGAGAGALLLTKINVGIFAALSFLAWVLLHHRNDAIRRAAPWLLIVAGFALPLGLMRILLSVPWVQTFALIFACAAAAAVAATARGATPRAGWRELGWAAAGAIGVGTVVLGVVFARGTTPHDLLEGVLLGPLRLPANFSLRFLWPSGIRSVAIGSTLLCAVACFLQKRPGYGSWVDPAVAVLRIAFATGVAVNVARFDRISPDNLIFAFVMPGLWLFLWPLAGGNPNASAARAWLGLLLLGQCLHVYPVPGSQIAWSSFLALPLTAIGAWDAATWLGRRFPRSSPRNWRWETIGLRVGVASFAVWAGSRLLKVGNRYDDGSDLALPGAEVLRLPSEATARFQLLTLNAVAHGDMLFSLPGMFSFNLWSDLPTPTLSNVTHWFSLLSDAQQHAIIRSLEAHPRACLIVGREHVNFLTGRGLRPSGPLADYLATAFVPAFTLDDFEFCVRRGRNIEPLMLAEALIIPETGGANTLLRVRLVLPADRKIASIEIAAVNNSSSSLLILNSKNARVEVAPIGPNGAGIGPAQTAAWPFRLEGAAQVSIYFNRDGRPRALAGGLIVLRDEAGAEIALARLRQ